jgi:FkbM family methyltransferase
MVDDRFTLLSSLFAPVLHMRSLGDQNTHDPLVNFVSFCMKKHRESKSQLFQDLLILYLLKEKRGGFFVEFGATNGVTLSNSYLLENDYGWKGILAEPATCWHKDLKKNRRAKTDHRCVWSESGKRLEFSETDYAELSTITSFVEKDLNRDGRQNAKKYQVETVSLNDLLHHHKAPKKIDYISIDTEGSELEILNKFDFNTFSVRIFTIEHNYTADRQKIHDLMAVRGYQRIMECFSAFDDWYVNSSDFQKLSLK